MPLSLADVFATSAKHIADSLDHFGRCEHGKALTSRLLEESHEAIASSWLTIARAPVSGVTGARNTRHW